MRKNISIVVIAFVTGFLGAYTFYKLNPVAPIVYHDLDQAQKARSVNFSGTNMDAGLNFVNASLLSTPSVVYIKTAASQQVSSNWLDFFFYGGLQSQVVISSGSGVIYSSDGYIITNNHVIARAEQIEVIHNRRSYKAKLVGTDPSTDLAVLKIEAENIPAIKIGSSRRLQVGDWVLAVGNPFNLESTVTAGIVSAKGRNINILKDRFPIESFIQTDAAINPGNSGGALVNLSGELVGINTAILSQTGSYAGYGFAVPIDIVRKIADDLIKYGEVQKTFIGADIAEINTEVAKKFNLNDYSGVVVTGILPDGPAEKVGMLKGDVITEINNDQINTKAAFDEELSYHRPGDKVRIKFRRDDKEIEGAIILTNNEGTTELIAKEVHFSELLGSNLETVPKMERQRLGIENGIRIGKVVSAGLISRLGISEGFIIIGLNSKKYSKPKELSKAFEQLRGRVIIDGITSEGQRGYYTFMF